MSCFVIFKFAGEIETDSKSNLPLFFNETSYNFPFCEKEILHTHI